MIVSPDSSTAIPQIFLSLTWSQVFWAAFSGAGAAFLIFILERVVESIHAKRFKINLREGLLRLLADEVRRNLHCLERMIADPNWRPYWTLSTDTKTSVWSEVMQLLPKDANLIRAISASYSNYALINRQLDLLHFRAEGLRATIYLDSTLPLAINEHKSSKKLLALLGERTQEEAIDPTPAQRPVPDYRTLTQALSKALVDNEDYFKCLSCFANCLFNLLDLRLLAPSGALGVSMIDDEQSRKGPEFLWTGHFRSNEGKLQFRINIGVETTTPSDSSANTEL